MAGDWIKMRTDLYRDPKVCVIADLLLDEDSALSRYVNQNNQRDMTVTRNVMRNAVVGALLSVWGVMRHRGKRINDDLSCYGVRSSVIDDISDIRGFGEAMAEVCWVIEEDDCIVFPRFFAEYNVEPDGQVKSKNAERQRRFRERKKAERNENSNATDNVTRDVTVTHREEKRREENKKTLSSEDDSKPPRIPYDDIFDVYEEVLCVPPHCRPSIRVRDDKRKDAIKKIVKIRPKAIHPDWWRSYFGIASQKENWMLGDKHRGGTWAGANFDFLLRDDNFKTILEENV